MLPDNVQFFHDLIFVKLKDKFNKKNNVKHLLSII